MKLNLKKVLYTHYIRTNEYITVDQLAKELVDAGIYQSIYSARNMVHYINSGKSKSLKIEVLDFLCERFNITINELLESF